MEIHLAEHYWFGLPTARISKERAQQLHRKLGNQLELHVDLEGNCCIGIPETGKNEMQNIQTLMNAILSLLYFTSHQEKYRKDPWPAYPHGHAGIDQKINEVKARLGPEKPEPNQACGCGSGRKYKRCCKRTLDTLEAEKRRMPPDAHSSQNLQGPS